VVNRKELEPELQFWLQEAIYFGSGSSSTTLFSFLYVYELDEDY
jgi:hypothetical protein